MAANFLPAPLYKQIQDSIPIACVDVVPLQVDPGNAKQILAVGLIHRDTPHQGQRWCTVGGRMLRNESFPEAITRQLHETLGAEIRFSLPEVVQPLHVAEYFTNLRTDYEPGIHDPRQHSIGLTFAVAITGLTKAQGEAVHFQWFAPEALPAAKEWGFHQDRVVAATLARYQGMTPD